MAMIGGSRSHIPFVKATQELGFKVLLFDQNGQSPGAAAADRFANISVRDVAGIVSRCSEHAQSCALRGVMTYVSHALALSAQARVSEANGLPGPTVGAVDLANHKDRVQMVLRRSGIRTPRGAVIESGSQLGEFVARHGPTVLKPSMGGTGSEGVVLVDEIDSLYEGAYLLAAGHSGDGKALAEQYCVGPQFSVDGYVQNGRSTVLGISRKRTRGPKHHFVIDGLVTESSPEEGGELERLSRRIVEELGIDHSFFSLDFIRSEEGFVVLDVGLLLDMKVDRLLAFKGVDVYRMRCKIATGQPLGEAKGWRGDRAYGIRFLYASSSGRFEPLVDAQTTGPISGHRSFVEWEREAGDMVNPPQSVADVLGWVGVEAANTDAAWELLCDQREADLFRVQAP